MDLEAIVLELWRFRHNVLNVGKPERCRYRRRGLKMPCLRSGLEGELNHIFRTL